MQPEFRLSRVGTVMLGVSDLDKSLTFYCNTLGLTVKMRLQELALLDAGTITLGITQALSRATLQKAGATEIVFQVENVRAAHASLVAQGVTFLREPAQVTPTDWAAHFRDPDGHLLSVFGPEGTV
ncbi:MAG TPA: VOC family protein [Verrucomicrobiae bacterium]|nr:VOC family protein [Verrucomicrobiae bacterium]